MGTISFSRKLIENHQHISLLSFGLILWAYFRARLLKRGHLTATLPLLNSIFGLIRHWSFGRWMLAKELPAQPKILQQPPLAS